MFDCYPSKNAMIHLRNQYKKSLQIAHFYYIIDLNNYHDRVRRKRALLNNNQKIIAVCMADIDTNYNDHFLKYLTKYSAEYNYKLLFFYSFSDLFSIDSGNKHDIGESSIFQLINYEIIDGIIIFAQTIRGDSVRNSIVARAKTHKIPVISTDYKMDDCYNVYFNYKNAMEYVVSHLIEKHHHKRINFIAGIRNNQYSDERLDVYKATLCKYNIPVEDERIGYGEFWSEPTKKVIDGFIASELPFPDAIVCANDSMAITAFHYLTELGYKIPEDVAITGFDGISEALEHTPSITTVQHDYAAMVEKAFDLLKNYFEGKQVPKQTYIDSKFIPGASCDCIKQDIIPYNPLAHKLYDQIAGYTAFNNRQIRMIADMTDSNSFQVVFEKVMKYTDNLFSHRFWVCIVDNFLNEHEEFSDILEEKSFQRIGYSSHMDVTVSRHDDEWQGMIDFETKNLLPSLPNILEEEDNVMFLPLHVLNHTIGYVAIVYEYDIMNMEHLYQFLMNISNIFENTKTRMRQQIIITSLETKYIHDPLTGILNRRGFYQKMQPIYDNCIAEQKKIMVVSVDMNRLKYINDTFGHSDGDLAISTLAKALVSAINTNEACARFGGDEFVVAGIIENTNREDEFKQAFQQYVDTFNKTSGKPYELSASIGIVTGIPTPDISLDEFIKYSDEEMYKEKVKHHLNRKE